MTIKKTEAIEGEVISTITTPKQKNVKAGKSSEPTYRQRKFAEAYMDGETMGNGTRSAIKAGYAERGAHVQASELLKNPKVLSILNDSVEEAEGIIRDLARSSESEAVRLAASKEILDRTIGKSIQRSLTVHANINVEDMLNSD